MCGLLSHGTLDTSTPTNQDIVLAYLWKAVFLPSFYLPTAYSTSVQFFFLSDIIEDIQNITFLSLGEIGSGASSEISVTSQATAWAQPF